MPFIVDGGKEKFTLTKYCRLYTLNYIILLDNGELLQ